MARDIYCTANRNKGFTLVELAIVITIIGLLIGGVLKGQQLVHQAKIAGTIMQVRDYQAALRIFKVKYDALPGDMWNASERIVGCANCTADGTAPLGDGKIGQGQIVWNNPQIEKGLEPVRFWLQLYKAGMISGVTDAALTDAPVEWGTTHPAAKLGGGFHAKTGNQAGGHGGFTNRTEPNGQILVLQAAIDGGPGPGVGPGHENRSHLMTAGTAAQFDRKVDDGKPGSGWVRGHGQGPICVAEDSAYMENNDRTVCGLAFVAMEE